LSNGESEEPFSIWTDTNGSFFFPNVSANVKGPYLIEVLWGKRVVYRDYIVRLGPQPPILLGEFSESHQPSPGQSATSVSTVCEFVSGPQSGRTKDYAPMDPLPIGTPCQDGQGSSGYVIPRQAPQQNGSTPNLSTICLFTDGPRRGQTQNYEPRPAVPIGSSCYDGMGSAGRVVAPP
jgi:hypothetical protein